jgi:hypothetical protein
VTLTFSEGAKTTCAEVIATAKRSIPLTEIGVKSVGMRKAVTGAIIIKVPGDKGREKALQLATHLSKVLDPTAVKVAAPTRMAELKRVGIDISIEKEELRQALALAAECGVAEIRVGEIGASRSGLGAAYVKCPLAAARELAQTGKVALGWSTARLHRTTAIRIAKGYRTISHASASVLAASPPFELQALALQQVYDHLRDLGSGNG